jgi:hypothetical protein
MKRSFGKMAQSSTRPEIISLDDSDDDDFASPPSPSFQPSVLPGDSRALLLDAIRLIEEEREAHKKTLEKKDNVDSIWCYCYRCKYEVLCAPCDLPDDKVEPILFAPVE